MSSGSIRALGGCACPSKIRTRQADRQAWTNPRIEQLREPSRGTTGTPRPAPDLMNSTWSVSSRPYWSPSLFLSFAPVEIDALPICSFSHPSCSAHRKSPPPMSSFAFFFFFPSSYRAVRTSYRFSAVSPSYWSGILYSSMFSKSCGRSIGDVTGRELERV